MWRCLVFSPWLFAGRNCGRGKRRRNHQAGRSREACGRIAGGLCAVWWCSVVLAGLFVGRNYGRVKAQTRHRAGRSREACGRLVRCGVHCRVVLTFINSDLFIYITAH